jgi:hypothetical protein
LDTTKFKAGTFNGTYKFEYVAKISSVTNVVYRYYCIGTVQLIYTYFGNKINLSNGQGKLEEAEKIYRDFVPSSTWVDLGHLFKRLIVLNHWPWSTGTEASRLF